MFRIMQKQWVAGLILIGLAVGALPVLVQAQEREPQPGDYYLIEFIAGSMGALLGGGSSVLIAYGIAYFLFSPLFPCDEHCRIAETWIYTIAFLSGVSIGGTYGVVGAGFVQTRSREHAGSTGRSHCRRGSGALDIRRGRIFL